MKLIFKILPFFVFISALYTAILCLGIGANILLENNGQILFKIYNYIFNLNLYPILKIFLYGIILLIPSYISYFLFYASIKGTQIFSKELEELNKEIEEEKKVIIKKRKK